MFHISQASVSSTAHIQSDIFISISQKRKQLHNDLDDISDRKDRKVVDRLYYFVFDVF